MFRSEILHALCGQVSCEHHSLRLCGIVRPQRRVCNRRRVNRLLYAVLQPEPRIVARGHLLHILSNQPDSIPRTRTLVVGRIPEHRHLGIGRLLDHPCKPLDVHTPLVPSSVACIDRHLQLSKNLLVGQHLIDIVHITELRILGIAYLNPILQGKLNRIHPELPHEEVHVPVHVSHEHALLGIKAPEPYASILKHIHSHISVAQNLAILDHLLDHRIHARTCHYVLHTVGDCRRHLHISIIVQHLAEAYIPVLPTCRHEAEPP